MGSLCFVSAAAATGFDVFQSPLQWPRWVRFWWARTWPCVSSYFHRKLPIAVFPVSVKSEKSIFATWVFYQLNVLIRQSTQILHTRYEFIDPPEHEYFPQDRPIRRFSQLNNLAIVVSFSYIFLGSIDHCLRLHFTQTSCNIFCNIFM